MGKREKSKMIEWAVQCEKKQETPFFGENIPKNLAFGSELAVGWLLSCGSAYTSSPAALCSLL
jgi:hypothetical protein